MRKNNKKAEFQKLKTKWYGKLKKSGFEDIESDEDNLKVWSSIFYLRRSNISWEAKASYYQMASNFLEEYKFTSNIEKIIWEYHSNGIGVRDISKLLKKAKIKSVKTARTSVWLIIKKLRSSMYQMYLAPKEEYHE